MESALASMIIFTTLLFAALTLSQTYMTTHDTLALSERVMQERILERARTDLSIITSTTKSSGSIIELTVRNEGKTKLVDFERWDVIVDYYQTSGEVLQKWLPYSPTSPLDNEWNVAGIYSNGASLSPEVYDPGILNSGEEAILQIKVMPSVGLTTTNRVTVSVPNGARFSTVFTR